MSTRVRYLGFIPALVAGAGVFAFACGDLGKDEKKNDAAPMPQGDAAQGFTVAVPIVALTGDPAVETSTEVAAAFTVEVPIVTLVAESPADNASEDAKAFTVDVPIVALP